MDFYLKEKEQRSGQEHWKIRKRLIPKPMPGIYGKIGVCPSMGFWGACVLVVHPSFSVGKVLEDIKDVVKVFLL